MKKSKLKWFLCIGTGVLLLYTSITTFEIVIGNINENYILENMSYRSFMVNWDSADDVTVKHMQIQKDEIKEVDIEDLDSSEYKGIAEPCLVGDTVYYDSYSVINKSPCIIKKVGSEVELVTLKFGKVDEHGISKTTHKVVKNNILYYQSDTNIYAFDLKTGQQKLIVPDANAVFYLNDKFDVNDKGDLLYTSNNNKFLLRKIVYANGEIRPLLISGAVFYSNNEIIYTFENKVYILNLDTNEKRKVARFTKENIGTSLFIHDVVLTPDKKQALIFVEERDGKFSYNYYWILDIESGRKYKLVNGPYFRNPVWSNKTK